MKFRRFTSVITLLAMAAVFLTGAFMFYAGAAEEPSSKSNLSEAFSKIQSDDESKDYQGIARGLIDGMDDVAGYLGNIAVSLFADAGEVDFDKIMEAFQGAVVAATPSDVQSTPTRPAGEEGEEPETKSFEETMGDYAQSIIDAMTDAAESESGVYQNKDGKLIWPDGEESPYVLTEDTLGFAVKALGELSFTRIG